MITANDVNMKRFEQARPGYKTEEVDEFLKEIADQLTQMIEEKNDTDNKIGILVESIRQYKNDEEALKEALIGAQKQARSVIAEAQERAEGIIAEAQSKAEQIISSANVKADEIIGSTGLRAEKAKEELDKLKREVSDFKSDILGMYKKHLELITSLPDLDDEEMPEETVRNASDVPAAASENDMDATRVMDSTVVFDTPEAAANHLSKLKK